MDEKETNKTRGNNTVISVVVTLIIAGGLGFYGGMKYQENKFANSFSEMRGTGQFPGRLSGQDTNTNLPSREGLEPVNGEIISSDENSITVKLNDGSTKIVFLADSTTINKAEIGSMDDLAEGETVMVMGTTNSDGSVNAQSIQLNLQDRGGMFKPEEDQ